ncbi:hypothetical protein HDV04_003791 [Boothiomyces sp. JEL0838]|nr:hypothetical protein HDV04_003791 [Boothiomyces sp. JEL0838]
MNTETEPTPKTLEELVTLINKEMGEYGLEDADVPKIQRLMASYQSNCNDWKKYALVDHNRYTRNLVDDGNGKFNLMILCWDAGASSPIHDHSNSHCVLKVLDGELLESLYNWPENSDLSAPPKNLTPSKESLFYENQVTYMHDKIGLHRVTNPTNKPSVSLHLYSPPYDYCKTFCEKTGAARQSGKCVFYSTKGVKNEYIEDLKEKMSFPHVAPLLDENTSCARNKKAL